MPSPHPSLKRDFGARVRDLRLRAGLTQEALSEHCGLFRTYMSRIESGSANPTLLMVQALSQSLRVPVHVLFVPEDRLEEELAALPRWPASALSGKSAATGFRRGLAKTASRGRVR